MTATGRQKAVLVVRVAGHTIANDAPCDGANGSSPVDIFVRRQKTALFVVPLQHFCTVAYDAVDVNQWKSFMIQRLLDDAVPVSTCHAALAPQGSSA